MLGQDGPVSPDERQALRRAMIDYGALQPSPVQRPVDTTKAPDTTIVRDSVAREVHVTLFFLDELEIDFFAAATPAFDISPDFNA